VREDLKTLRVWNSCLERSRFDEIKDALVPYRGTAYSNARSKKSFLVWAQLYKWAAVLSGIIGIPRIADVGKPLAHERHFVTWIAASEVFLCPRSQTPKDKRSRVLACVMNAGADRSESAIAGGSQHMPEV
jgi:hypothetical protein